MQKVTKPVATGKAAERKNAVPHFKGNRKRFIPAAIREVLGHYEDAELRFLCLIGMGGAATQGLLDIKAEPNLVRDLDAAARTARGSVLRETLPLLSDENLDTWACYFFRLAAAHDLGEHGEAAVRLTFSGANLSGQRRTYPKPDARLYHEVHGLIDALPRNWVEAIRKELHQVALGLKASESGDVLLTAG
jgi:hypothetical protein